MATDKRRIRWALAISGGVLIVGAGITWFAVLPYVIEQKIGAQLEAVTEKTGRTVALSGIQLTGLKSAAVDRITVSDVGKPEHIGLTIDNVSVGLSNIPVDDNFRIDSIDIDGIEIALRSEDGKTNFDDILEKLKKSEKKGGKGPRKATWKRFVTPMPEIEIDSIALTMTPYTIDKSLKIGALALNDIRIAPPEDAGKFEKYNSFTIDAKASALLVEDDVPTTYKSTLTGRISGSDDGFVAMSYPRADDHSTPECLDRGGAHIAFEQVRFVLPTTLEVGGLSVTENDNQLISADKAKIWLMKFPPAKVSGIYFKEIELVRPAIHEYWRTDNKSAIFQYAGKLKDSWLPKSGTKRAKAAPKETKVEDYFFTQRMIVTDGSLIVEDQRKNPMVDIKIGDLDVEIGYRNIQKKLDYRIGIEFNEPFMSRLTLGGAYHKDGEYVDGALDISSMRAGRSLKKFQVNLREQHDLMVAAREREIAESAKGNGRTGKKPGAEKAAPVPEKADPQTGNVIVDTLFSGLLPSFDLEEAALGFRMDYRYDIKKSRLELDSSLETSGGLCLVEAISPEPMPINGKISAEITAGFDPVVISLDSIKLASNGNELSFGLVVKKDTVVPKTGLKIPKTAWHFDFKTGIEPQPAQEIYEAIPHALRPDIDGMEWAGNIGLNFSVSGYFNNISEAKHKFDITTTEDFGVLTWPIGRNVTALNEGFVHHVIDPNALEPHDIVVPPSVYPIVINEIPTYTPRMTAEEVRVMYPDWVLFDDINPWLIQLITTTEDGSFFTHSGFSPMQIKAAIERNISRASFSRGASTISMQLVKNLFFDRSKTISRKFQEVIYTWLMESVVQIPKQRIMELYFNIIEFGPEIYGIEEAAKYYFGKKSDALSLKECAFLMSIIPNPRKGAEYRMQPTLSRGLLKMMNFYIKEMYRRKCEPEMIERMHRRFEKLGRPVPFEPCCPPKDSLRLMLDSNELSFYLPNPEDPLVYGYRPDLYDETGRALFPVRRPECGYKGGDLFDLEPEEESIFETSLPDPFLFHDKFGFFQ